MNELDDDHPLWLVNEQIKGLLEGIGAGEDHEDVLNFLRATGLPEGTIARMHKALVHGDTKVRVESAEPVAYANRDELDNMLDDRTATVAGVRDGWRNTPLFARPQPAIPPGFSREDLEAVAEGLDWYEKEVNVGSVAGEGGEILESTTAYAARFIRAMLQAVQSQPAIPPGWRLVPEEPTREMLEAGEVTTTTIYHDFSGNEHVEIGANSAETAYRAMLQAAPEMPKCEP